MDNVWILGGLRSFVGVKDGMYRKISAEILGAQVLKEIKNRFALKDNEIDYIIGGNAVAGGHQRNGNQGCRREHGECRLPVGIFHRQ